jgi:hypothetical protein
LVYYTFSILTALQSAAIRGDPSTAVIGDDPSTARISAADGGDPSTARISFPFAMLNPADNQLDPSTANPQQVRQPCSFVSFRKIISNM